MCCTLSQRKLGLFWKRAVLKGPRHFQFYPTRYSYETTLISNFRMYKTVSCILQRVDLYREMGKVYMEYCTILSQFCVDDVAILIHIYNRISTCLCGLRRCHINFCLRCVVSIWNSPIISFV